MSQLVNLSEKRRSTSDDAFALLKQHSLFAAMPEDMIALFSSAAATITLKKADQLFLQDDPAEWFYFIASGWIKLFRETIEGDEAVLDVLTKGHIFGEAAVFDGGIHTVGAAVAEDAVLVRLPISLLKSAITKNHEVALGMLASISRERRHQSQDIEKLSLQNTSQRIACFLLRMCQANQTKDVALTLPYDKSLIAARLSMKSETFSRALNKLQKETSISIKGSGVTIPDIGALATFACSHCSQEFPCGDLH